MARGAGVLRRRVSGVKGVRGAGTPKMGVPGLSGRPELVCWRPGAAEEIVGPP